MSSSDTLKVEKLIVTDELISNLAEKYISIRSKIPTYDENHPLFRIPGFSTDVIKEIIKVNTKPLRIDKEKRRAVNDIYRSDLGELLLIDYFEETEKFTLPLKNLWDREHNDLPGRGFDGIGYRKKLDGRYELLLGEAKVTSAISTPPVVDYNDDSMFNTHLKHKSDKKYLERKIANFAKKITGDDGVIIQYLLFSLSNNDDSFDILFGCCMLRDDNCHKNPDDFGKFNTDCNCFRPGFVHFIIYSFDKSLEEVINLFHDKVEAA